MAEGSYHLGDFVYMEVEPAPAPYRICRLEELSKTTDGRIEALVTCMFRRRDLPPVLAQMADKFAAEFEESEDCLWSTNHLDTIAKHQLRHREVFLCRDYETYEISLIRGKCSVTLLCEVETPDLYLNRPDAFYYSLVYDPQVKTLQADKNSIRVGDRYQAEVPDTICPDEIRDPDAVSSQMWNPSAMPHKEIDQFMVLARSVGTFARAMITSKTFQPTLHASAAAASRDTTLLHAMTVLHRSNYDLSTAVGFLVPQGGPLLCRDEMENWTAEEANVFESALQSCGKDFYDIQRDHLTWKSVKSIVEYYYMWKTSDRYAYTKQQKLLERQNKLRDFAIKRAPGHFDSSGGGGAGGSAGGHGRGNSNALLHHQPSTFSGTGSQGGMSSHTGGSGQGESGRQQSGLIRSNEKIALIQGSRPCEGCKATFSSCWKDWGPSEQRLKLCALCWDYWRKYAGLKLITKWENMKQMKVYASESYTCPHCYKFFTRKERLTTHLREHPLPAGKLHRVNHSVYRLFCMRPKSSVFLARKLLGSSELRRCAIEPSKLINLSILKSKNYPPRWIPICRRVRQVIEPDGEVDGKSIYTVATVYQDGGEADGTGHTRRPIQKLLDSPTLAARDAKKKAKTPTSTDPPSIIGQPKSREEAMADAMFKMHQEKLKKVSSHSAAKATGSSSLMKSEQRKGIKRPAINITRAEVMQPSSKKVATALTTVVPSPKKMGTAFASVIPLTKKAVSSCTAMILSPKKVSIPSTAVTVMPPSKTTSTKVTTTSTAALLPKTQIQRDTQAYKQAETSDRAVQIDVLKPTSAKPASAKPASAKPASTKPVSAKPISAKPKTLANVARSRSARENGYSYHTPVGELFYFRVPLTQKQNRSGLQNRRKLRILARTPCSRVALMKMRSHAAVTNGPGPRSGRQVAKRHVEMDEVIDRMKLDVQPGRSAGDLVIVN